LLKSLSCSSTPRPALSCPDRNTSADSGLTAPEAMGRLRVRATSASMSRSHRSFIVHLRIDRV
jgi:hypothetical protein